MPAPLETENRFQDLLVVLSFPSSPRQRLQVIREFLVSLKGQMQAAEPYILDVAQRLPDILRQLQPEGVPPEELQALLHSFQELAASLPVLRSVKDLDESLELLKRDLAHQLVCVGEIEQAALLFSDTPLLLTISAGTSLVPLELLEHGLLAAREQKHPAAVHFAEFLRIWKERTRSVPGHTIFPAVEKPLAATGQPSAGRLRGVSVELFGEAKNGSDDIRADVAVLQEGERDFLLPAFAAVRPLMADTHPHLVDCFYSGRIRFDDLTALHEGTSANLAVAALVYCEILRYSNQRTVFQLSLRVAFTGGIGNNGEVVPIESSSLAAKVEAAFFSWLDYLAAPRTQATEAEAVVRKLREAFPKRALTIIGVGNVRDVLYDRRLSEMTSISSTRHVARFLWKQRVAVAAIVVVVALALTVGKLLYGPVDKNPVDSEYVGEMLFVKNLHGETVDQIRVGKNTVLTANNPSLSIHHNRLFSPCDIDSDGINEVFWAQKGSDGDGQLSFVGCKSIGTDSIRWWVCIRKKLSFVGRTDIENDIFRVDQIAVGDFSHTGRPEVIILANHQLFPSLILRLDALTGKELSYYLNIGQLGAFELADLDGDGFKEVIAVGANNSYRDGVVVVLDSRFIVGHSPAQGNYIAKGSALGLERFYVRIPRTVVGGALPVHTNGAVTILVNDSSRIVEIGVADAPASVTGDAGLRNAVLNYLFSFKFVPQTIGTSSDYDVLAEHLFRVGGIGVFPDRAYLDRHLRKVQFWDGGGWQNKPVMNQRYLEVVIKFK